MLTDLRFAIRQLFKQPGFTAIVVLSLAVGIGATTAVFSLLNGTLLRSSPYAARGPVGPRGELVFVTPEKLDGSPYTDGFNGAQVLAMQAQTDAAHHLPIPASQEAGEAAGAPVGAPANSFHGVAPYHWTFNFLIPDSGPTGPRSASPAVSRSGETAGDGQSPQSSESVEGLQVTHELFSVLGVAPLLGRTFTPEEKEVKDHPVVVLGYHLWQRQFAGDPAIVGQTIRISRMPPLTVIGVMPPGLRFLPSRGAAQEPNYNLHAYVDYWLPNTPNPANVNGRYWSVVARLAPGVSLAQAQAEMTQLAASAAQTDPALAGMTAVVTPIADVLDRDIRRIVLPLFGAVSFVLLIAGANVAGLLLVRGLGRQRELAVRAALGAGGGRLLRLTLTESLLLALAGGALGSALAFAAVKVLTAVGASSIPRLDDVAVDWRVAGFALAVSLLVGLGTGLLTAWQALRPDLNRVIKDSGHGTGSGSARQRMLGLLVAGEVALTLVLLIGAGLMLRTMVSLARVDPGYQIDRILTMTVTTLQEDRAGFHRRALEAVQPLPGVQAAAFAWGVPLTGNNWMGPFAIEGRGESDQLKDQVAVPYRSVTPEYFGLMNIALREGRFFDARDQGGAPAVAIINEALAQRYFPGENAVGRKIVNGRNGTREIIGVVADLRSAALTAPVEPEVYLSFFQQMAFSKSLVVRAAGDTRALIPAVRRALQGVDPAVVIEEIKTMDAIRDQSIAAQRFAMTLIAAFAVVALALAVVGLYGVMSHAVAQRSHEIGIRMAIGAQRHHVLRMILRQGALLAGLGIVLGLAGALMLTGTLRSLLFGVDAADPLTFVAVPVVLLGVVLLACLIPARRATKIDPLVALRAE